MTEEHDQKIFEQNFESLMNIFQQFLKDNSASGLIAIKKNNEQLHVMTGEDIYEASKIACKTKDIVLEALFKSVHSNK